MNKKLTMIGAGVVAGSVLLMSSVYAGIGNAPGYDTYKSAIKNTVAVDNVTQKVNLTVEDNGKVLLQVDSTIKTGNDDVVGSAEVTLLSGETTQSIQIYNQDDKKIIKTSNSDVYQIVVEDAEEQAKFKKFRARNGEEQHDPAFAQEMENIVDTLVGNLKNYVTLNEDGANKEVGLHLKGNQIPALANTIGSLVIRAGGSHHGEEEVMQPEDTFGINLQSIQDKLPKLAEDIKIDAVSLDADVNSDNLITSQAAVIEISGKDIQSAEHQVVVKLTLDSSNFNSTTPDTIDLTGKKVENVMPLHEAGFKHWNN